MNSQTPPYTIPVTNNHHQQLAPPPNVLNIIGPQTSPPSLDQKNFQIKKFALMILLVLSILGYILSIFNVGVLVTLAGRYIRRRNIHDEEEVKGAEVRVLI